MQSLKNAVDELILNNEYQLRLKDMNYKEKVMALAWSSVPSRRCGGMVACRRSLRPKDMHPSSATRRARGRPKRGRPIPWLGVFPGEMRDIEESLPCGRGGSRGSAPGAPPSSEQGSEAEVFLFWRLRTCMGGEGGLDAADSQVLCGRAVGSSTGIDSSSRQRVQARLAKAWVPRCRARCSIHQDARIPLNPAVA